MQTRRCTCARIEGSRLAVIWMLCKCGTYCSMHCVSLIDRGVGDGAWVKRRYDRYNCTKGTPIVPVRLGSSARPPPICTATRHCAPWLWADTITGSTPPSRDVGRARPTSSRSRDRALQIYSGVCSPRQCSRARLSCLGLIITFIRSTYTCIYQDRRMPRILYLFQPRTLSLCI